MAHQSATMLGCLDAADDAADALEEGAFLLMLLVRNGGAMRPFAGLAELLDDDARALVTALECAAHLNSAGPREDLDEFLAAVQRIFDIEHAADKALRHKPPRGSPTRWASASCSSAPSSPRRSKRRPIASPIVPKS